MHYFHVFVKQTRLNEYECICECFQADPYVQVRLGTTKLDTSDEYVPNTLNPVFGKLVSVNSFIQPQK